MTLQVIHRGEMDCSTAKCYSHDQDSHPCPQGHTPHALTPGYVVKHAHRCLFAYYHAGSNGYDHNEKYLNLILSYDYWTIAFIQNANAHNHLCVKQNILC